MLVVAAAQPRVVEGDVARNVDAHAESIARAKARLVVFPELSLTGYAVDAPAIDMCGAVVDALASVCAATDSVALVGAPVEVRGARYIAMVRLDGDGAAVAYRKTFLGETEYQHFRAGPGPRAMDVDGWRVGLGICRDTGIDAHVQGTAALGVDVYACGVVHHAAELPEQQRRGRNVAVTCRAPVVMASFAGPAGGGYSRAAGCSAIWSASGSVLAEADGLPGAIARAALTRSSRGHHDQFARLVVD